MKNKIIEAILRILGQKFDGYKTKTGGVGLILTGLGSIFTGASGIVRKIYPDIADLPDLTMEQCFPSITAGGTMIGVGFGYLGLGGKQEKTKAAIERQTEVISEQNTLIAEQNELIRKKNPSGMSPEG